MPQSPNNSLGSLAIVDGGVPPDFLLKLNDRLRRIEQALGLVRGDGNATSALSAQQAVEIVNQGALATLNAVDLGTDQVVNKLIDYLSDTANYAKVSVDALAGNLIDLSKPGVIGKILDNIADSATYAKVSATALTGSSVDLARPGVIGKTMDNIAATATWGKVLAAALTTEGEIDLAAAQVINKNLDNIAGTATWGKVLASSLAATGAIDLSVAGVLNKTLDHIGDTATWRKVTGVNTSNQTSTGTYAPGSLGYYASATVNGTVTVPGGQTVALFASDVPTDNTGGGSYIYVVQFSGHFEVPNPTLYVGLTVTMDGGNTASPQYIYPLNGTTQAAITTPLFATSTNPGHSVNMSCYNGSTDQMAVYGTLAVLTIKT